MTLDPHDIVLRPRVTEKLMGKMESSTENKLVFVVARTATKPQIKWAIEKLFDAKVVSVNTQITTEGLKQAHVKFAEGVSAEDIGMRVGIF
ncbi:MAG TPA: 50S ribosomal protein L23 [Candidatus Thermoplasmatota archaeon]|jgi:large subunit ribosomal protein L23|nr:50S ribosomal protein L23 [Candidatus Thermoplasmatota archaeon]